MSVEVDASTPPQFLTREELADALRVTLVDEERDEALRVLACRDKMRSKIVDAMCEGKTCCEWYGQFARDKTSRGHKAIAPLLSELQAVGWHTLLTARGKGVFSVTTLYWRDRPYTWLERIFL